MFHYSPTRSHTVAEELLQGFNGILQTDGYAGYAAVCAKNGLRHAGCWAHDRRKFDEALKAQGKDQLCWIKLCFITRFHLMLLGI